MLGDFNVHVCCASDHLASEFLNIIDSFNLVQWVKEPTHNRGHMLDLILSFGLSITDTEVIELPISDHFPIIFKMALPAMPYITVSDLKQVRVYSPRFCEAFTERYNEITSSVSYESLLLDLDVEQHLESLNIVWLEILNAVAPYRLLKPQRKAEPWLDQDIRSRDNYVGKQKENGRKTNFKYPLPYLKNVYGHIRVQLRRPSLFIFLI